MAYVRQECPNCEHVLITQGCVRLSRGIPCEYKPKSGEPVKVKPDWVGDVDEPHVPTAAELSDLYRLPNEGAEVLYELDAKRREQAQAQPMTQLEEMTVAFSNTTAKLVEAESHLANAERQLRQATTTAMLQSAFEKQVGGSHYKDMAIQPIEYILANELGFVEGAVIKYVSRWQVKGGVQDLKKARHLLDLLIETLENPTPSP